MKLIPNRQIIYRGKRYEEGEAFDASEQDAADLLQRDVVRRVDPPRILYDSRPEWKTSSIPDR